MISAVSCEPASASCTGSPALWCWRRQPGVAPAEYAQPSPVASA